MGVALGPAVTGQDIDIERRGPAGNGKATGKLGRGHPDRVGVTEFQERSKGAGGEVEVGEGVGGGAIEGAGGLQQLPEGIESRGILGIVDSLRSAREGQPLRMNRWHCGRSIGRGRPQGHDRGRRSRRGVRHGLLPTASRRDPDSLAQPPEAGASVEYRLCSPTRVVESGVGNYPTQMIVPVNSRVRRDMLVNACLSLWGTGLHGCQEIPDVAVGTPSRLAVPGVRPAGRTAPARPGW